MNTTLLALVATECKAAAEKETTLEGRVTAAMKAAKNHWMVTDDNSQFQGAVAAIYELSDDETKERIKAEMDSLRYLSAMMSGVAVDFDAIPKLENPIGLMKSWRECAA